MLEVEIIIQALSTTTVSRPSVDTTVERMLKIPVLAVQSIRTGGGSVSSNENPRSAFPAVLSLTFSAEVSCDL